MVLFLPNIVITFVPATVRVPDAVTFAVLIFAVEHNDTVTAPTSDVKLSGVVATRPFKILP